MVRPSVRGSGVVKAEQGRDPLEMGHDRLADGPPH